MAPWYAPVVTIVRQLAAWVTRAFYAGPSGLWSAGATPAIPDYSPLVALSTLAQFAWVRVCVEAVAGDLSALPLAVVARDPVSGQWRDAGDDPALRLLASPSPGVSGTILRAQLLADQLCTGDAYLWVPGLQAWRDGAAEYPIVAWRLHPVRVVPVVGPMGSILGYSYTDTSTLAARVVQIPVGDVLHWSGISWRDDARSVLGESVLRCLHDELVAELEGRKLGAKWSKKGRPDMLFSVDGAIDEKIVQQILARYQAALASDHGGFVLGQGVKGTPISWTPKEFVSSERYDRLRDAILALFGVTPARAGLVTANYGTDRQQARTYWSGLVRRAAGWDEVLSRLVPAGRRLEHDFADVEALQVSYSERLGRVQAWVALGATPARAAAYEGFRDAPVPDQAVAGAGSSASTSPRTGSEDGYQGDRQQALLELAIGTWLRQSVPRWEAARGAELELVVRQEVDALVALLRSARVPTALAEAWADDVVRSTAEAVTYADPDAPLEALRGFGEERAARLARQLVRVLGAHTEAA